MEEARGNEEREDFFKSSGYDKLELKHQNLVFFKLIECIIKMSWCETEAKRCAMNVVFILGGQRIDQKRKKGWWRGRRERIEKGSREIEIERKRQKGID